jgi:hypothetical protein
MNGQIINIYLLFLWSFHEMVQCLQAFGNVNEVRFSVFLQKFILVKFIVDSSCINYARKLYHHINIDTIDHIPFPLICLFCLINKVFMIILS